MDRQTYKVAPTVVYLPPEKFGNPSDSGQCVGAKLHYAAQSLFFSVTERSCYRSLTASAI